MLDGLNADILERSTSVVAMELNGNSLSHFGIKGQKWGVRRYQNSDGSLTEEGKLRYSDTRQSMTRKNLTKGQVRFAKDALISLEQTSLSKDPNKFKETIKQLGKAAEESGAMDPNNERSPYDLSRSPDQSRIFGKIYENMPTVEHNTDEYYKQRASEYKKNAESFKQEKTKALDDYIDEFHHDIHKELGTKKGADTRNYLIDAIKGYNEGDPDMVTYQHMDDVVDLSMDGYIDKETFNKMYDGQAAEDAISWLGYGLGTSDIKKYNSWYKELHHSEVKVGDFLAHHGIKGQKWGNRRYQNPDGSLTDLGRVRYGASSALKKTGSAIGKAIRKATGRQTDAELDAEVEKARKRNERRDKKEFIKKSKETGRKKPLRKMNDQELDDYIDRLSKERNVRRMEKELKEMNRGPAKKMIAGLADNAVSGVGEGIKRGLSSKIETSMRKNEERKQNLKDEKFKDKHKSKEEKASEKLQRTKNDTQNKLDIVKNETERKALLGNDVYSKRLEEVAAAKKGNKRSNDYGGKDALAKLEAAEYKMAYQALFSDDAKKKYKAYRDATGRGSKGKKNN